MIEIYRIVVESESSLILLDNGFTEELRRVLSGCREVEDWEPPLFRLESGAGDGLVGTPCGTFAIPEHLAANIRLMECLELSGELLPIELDTGERYQILSPTGCVNSLNTTESVFGDSGSQQLGNRVILRHIFHPVRIPCSPIFRIPETHSIHIYASKHARLHSESDFLTVYEEEGLTGLSFEKVWEGG